MTSGLALERVFRAASGRIIAALAARYRNLALAEDAFSEACLRALRAWPDAGVPDDPAAWLYRTASRVILDALRQQSVRERHSIPEPPPEPSAEDLLAHDSQMIPDERLRLIFICCHPAVAQDARAALTLRLVCGLTVTEIARAFLIEEAALAQRLVRAKRKIAEAGVSFELPPPELWPERVEAVLSTLEIAYSRAHEDASGTAVRAHFAAEVLHLTSLLTQLLPGESAAHALAALVRYSEARRPARVDSEGMMVPLSEQDPRLWNRERIAEADALLGRAAQLGPPTARLLQAELQRAWCARASLAQSPPWPEILRVYDRLLQLRDDPFVRINRAVALAEIRGPEAALQELARLDGAKLTGFAPYHAVRADFLARVGRHSDARQAYETVLALDPPPAEKRWIHRRLAMLENGAVRT
ncbi:MAG TPA: sigma-70 family RNA polymerase sigma factor [Steroidobacteraceae bacterium]|nr:sigma-70 family RNA polymerase sigma factor [Steroidobacteraceae bacterium]